MPPSRSLAPWSTTTGGSEAQGEYQTQTYEAQSAQRLRGRRSPWHEEQGIFCLDRHSRGRYDKTTYA